VTSDVDRRSGDRRSWKRGEDKGEEFEPGTVFAETLTLPLSLRKGEATKKSLSMNNL